VGPRPGLDDIEMGKFLTLQALELKTLGRSARRQACWVSLLIFVFKFLGKQRSYHASCMLLCSTKK
jgi:hypothetical protein